MTDYPIQGRLRICKDSFERDLPFLKAHVELTSQPALKSHPTFTHLQFWYVDFATTSEQWRIVQPELEQRDIFVSLYESPALLGDDQPEKPIARERNTRRSRFRWVPIAGVVLIGAGVIGALVLNDATLLCASGVGLVIALVGGAIVAVQEM